MRSESERRRGRRSQNLYFGDVNDLKVRENDEPRGGPSLLFLFLFRFFCFVIAFIHFSRNESVAILETEEE
jgi:hypothetical protein